MRGLQNLVSIRRTGMRPDLVMLCLPGMGLSSGILLPGQVLIEDKDRPDLADLRPLVGLRVVVMALTGCFAAAEAWMLAACRAGARDVGLAFLSPSEGLDGPVWVRVDGEQLA